MKLRLQIVQPKEKITNDWSVSRVAKECVPPTWHKVFEDAAPEINDVSEIVDSKKQEARIVPDMNNLFNAFWLTPLNRVNVVILGQDPYIGILPDGNPQAVGLSFSVPRGAPIPPSLVNIYKEIKNTVAGFQIPSHGDLTSWARQGVLLLNMSLTTNVGTSAAHGNIWNGFIKKAVKAVLDVNQNTIFVLWGKEAQKIKKFIGGRAIFLEAGHPSPLSVRYFMNNNHFNKINELLISQGKAPINWNLD